MQKESIQKSLKNCGDFLDNSGFYRESDEITEILCKFSSSQNKTVISQNAPISLNSSLGESNFKELKRIIKGIQSVFGTNVDRLENAIKNNPKLSSIIAAVLPGVKFSYNSISKTLEVPKSNWQYLMDFSHAAHPAMTTLERGEKILETTTKIGKGLEDINALTKIKSSAEKALHVIEKFKAKTIPGMGLSIAQIFTDVGIIIHKSEILIENIHNKEEVMIKDAIELALAIARLASNPVVISMIPPLAPLLVPPVSLWVAGVNTTAIALGVAVEGADALGKYFGTTNMYSKNMEDILNEPGSMEKLTMPISDLKVKYGEIYNALVDFEKGMGRKEAFDKHIPARDPLKGRKEAIYVQMLSKRDELIKKQADSKIEIWPSKNSQYVISSYRKERKEREKRLQEMNERNFPGNFGGGNKSTPNA